MGVINRRAHSHWTSAFTSAIVSLMLAAVQCKLLWSRNKHLYKRTIHLHCEKREVTFTTQYTCIGICINACFGYTALSTIGIHNTHSVADAQCEQDPSRAEIGFWCTRITVSPNLGTLVQEVLVAWMGFLGPRYQNSNSYYQDFWYLGTKVPKLFGT